MSQELMRATGAQSQSSSLYRLLEDKPPATTIVSIGHRSTLDAFHQRSVALARDGDQFVLKDAGEARAP